MRSAAPEQVKQCRRAHENEENESYAHLGQHQAGVQLFIPEPEERQGTKQSQQGEPAPVAGDGEGQDAQIQHQHVGEDLPVTRQPAGQEQWRGEPAQNPKDGNGPRIMAQRQSGGGQGHKAGKQQGGRCRDQVIENVGGVYRQVQYGYAATCDRLGPRRIPASPEFAAGKQGRANCESHNDPAGLPYPVIVEGELEKKANPDDQRQGADAGQPVAPYQPFPVAGGPGALLVSGRRRGRRFLLGSGRLRGFHRCSVRSSSMARRFQRRRCQWRRCQGRVWAGKDLAGSFECVDALCLLDNLRLQPADLRLQPSKDGLQIVGFSRFEIRPTASVSQGGTAVRAELVAWRNFAPTVGTAHLHPPEIPVWTVRRSRLPGLTVEYKLRCAVLQCAKYTESQLDGQETATRHVILQVSRRVGSGAVLCERRRRSIKDENSFLRQQISTHQLQAGESDLSAFYSYEGSEHSLNNCKPAEERFVL